MRELGRAQDGAEVKAWELERITERAHNLGDRRDAFEKLRDFAANACKAETGEQWRPRHGSHASQTGHLTSAAIDARDFIRARKDRETCAHLPDGTLVAVAGGKEAENVRAIWNTLDRVKTRHADVILVHGGGPGAEKIAASWAERNRIHQIVCKPDRDRHGRAAPFRRNDDLLNLLPKGVVAFPGSGITENLIDKAHQLGIPVHRVAARAQPPRAGPRRGIDPSSPRRRRRPCDPPSRPRRPATLAGPAAPISFHSSYGRSRHGSQFTPYLNAVLCKVLKRLRKRAIDRAPP